MVYVNPGLSELEVSSFWNFYKDTTVNWEICIYNGRSITSKGGI